MPTTLAKQSPRRLIRLAAVVVPMLAACQEVLAERSTDESDIGITLFSALNKRGVDDTALMLRGWVDA